MAVISNSEYGWVICVKTYFDQIYSHCRNQNSDNLRIKFRDVFFQIDTPFLMDSAALKNAHNILGKVSHKEKKKKKSRELDEIKMQQCWKNSSIESIIVDGARSLLSTAYDLNYLDNSELTAKDWFTNNGLAREAAKSLPLFVSKELIDKSHCDIPVIKVINGDEYILPPHSSFHACDIQSSYRYLKGIEYDLILIDPPWQNKSVRRKKGYSTMNTELLDEVPIEQLTHSGSLIVVWVTNNSKQIAYVEERLFPKWNVSHFVMWHWVKVTKKGQFVYPIDSHHKKPYEHLLIGRVSYDGISSTIFSEMEDHKLIVSVPSSIHSHKPPLIEILKSYLPDDPRCLELFARYLLPGWTSVGNEVLKLQNMKLFERVS